MSDKNQSLPPPELDLPEESLTDDQYDRFYMLRNYIQGVVYHARPQDGGFRPYTRARLVQTITPSESDWTPTLEVSVHTFEAGVRRDVLKFCTNLNGQWPVLVTGMSTIPDTETSTTQARLSMSLQHDIELIRDLFSGHVFIPLEVFQGHDSHFMAPVEEWMDCEVVERVRIKVKNRPEPLAMYMQKGQFDSLCVQPNLWVEYSGYPQRVYSFISKERIN